MKISKVGQKHTHHYVLKKIVTESYSLYGIHNENGYLALFCRKCGDVKYVKKFN